MNINLQNSSSAKSKNQTNQRFRQWEKAENIKRAKWLRKREQDALIAAGLGPASKELQQRDSNPIK